MIRLVCKAGDLEKAEGVYEQLVKRSPTNDEYQALLNGIRQKLGKEVGLSGAGERIPAAAQDASRPGSRGSNMATPNPARANSKAIELPISPPPATIASKVFIPSS